MSSFTLLDGPMGSQLTDRGVETSLPLWSARALWQAPSVVSTIHRDYVEAGATVHRANTFRATPRLLGGEWFRWAKQAVLLARKVVPAGQKVAGSVGPLEDCYSPEKSPPAEVARAEHRELVVLLAELKVDLLLCESFPNPAEALIAVEECVRTGLPTWVSLTAGPDGTLLTPQQLAEGARACVAAGAQAVLVNCVAATHTLPYVQAISALSVPFGAYANASLWGRPPAPPRTYAACARTWLDAGATLVGACCGTSPAHTRELALLRGAA